MTEVMVERSYPEPLTDEVLNGNLEAALPCLNLHRVQWRRSFLSIDRHELICHFTARDAESVRIALQQAGARRGLIWSCDIENALGTSEESLQQAGVYACCTPTEGEGGANQLGELCGSVCLDTHRVTALRSYRSKDGQRMIALYHAPDAESVRLALHGSRLLPERVRAFSHLMP